MVIPAGSVRGDGSDDSVESPQQKQQSRVATQRPESGITVSRLSPGVTVVATRRTHKQFSCAAQLALPLLLGPLVLPKYFLFFVTNQIQCWNLGVHYCTDSRAPSGVCHMPLASTCYMVQSDGKQFNSLEILEQQFCFHSSNSTWYYWYMRA
jgi:hypothetical protein